ncbi:MAG: transporter substrate-binding domain-containing protein [Tepidanaerobacteraceae bacterium]
MKNLSKVFVLFMCIFLIAGLVAGCSQSQQPEEGQEAGGNQGEKDIWVVGTSADYPPFESVDENGEFIGFDMDIIREVADRLGVELKIESMEFDSLIASLKQGKIDAIIACMSPDEERLKEADFTDAYYITKHGLLVKEEGGAEINKLEDILGYDVGVQTGTTMDKWITGKVEEGAIPADNVNRYSDANAGALDVKQGRLDVFIVDAPVAYEKAKEVGLVVALETVLEKDENPGIVLKKGSTDMLEKLNGIIQEMKDDGTIQQLEEKWIKQ